MLVFFGGSIYLVFLISFYRVRKYPILGSLRACLQSVSFELVFFFFILVYFFYVSSIILVFFFVSCFSFFFSFVFFLLFLVEVGRAPFDLLESERELVRGYNTEYFGLFFVFIFLREYGFLFFFRYFLSFFFDFIFLFVFLFVFLFLRCVYPRLRIDVFFSFF